MHASKDSMWQLLCKLFFGPFHQLNMLIVIRLEILWAEEQAKGGKDPSSFITSGFATLSFAYPVFRPGM
jgi:hypothetical protein